MSAPKQKILREKLDGMIFEYCLPHDFTGLSDNVEAIILLDGLPSIPKQKELLRNLATKGYVVILPRYLGTWESEGEFLKDTPVLEISNLITKLKSGLQIREVLLKVAKITVVGSSFGGAVALSLSDNPQVDKILAYSSVFDFTKVPRLEGLRDYINHVYTMAYRHSQDSFKRLVSGQILNPADQLAKKVVPKIFVISTREDHQIIASDLEVFCQKFAIPLEILEGNAHYSIGDLGEEMWENLQNYLQK